LYDKLRAERSEYKALKSEQRNLMAEIKQLHGTILSLDDKSKKLTSLIKEEKESGKAANKKTDG